MGKYPKMPINDLYCLENPNDLYIEGVWNSEKYVAISLNVFKCSNDSIHKNNFNKVLIKK
jgi:hypothetical protein